MKKSSLKEKKKILENNIKFEQDMIDNDKHYDNKELNMSFGPNHYKRAIEYDKRELEDVNGKLATQERINAIKERRNSLFGKKKKKGLN